MRLEAHDVLTDHALLADVGPNDHHAQAASAKVIVNSQAIGPGAYQLRVDLGRTGCKVLRAILRGEASVDLQGHEGVFVLGGATSGNSQALGLVPYPSGVQSYMGGYSRLHGDGYLSQQSFGQNAIRLQDAFLDGSDAVLVFYNVAPTAKNLKVYGTVIAK